MGVLIGRAYVCDKLIGRSATALKFGKRWTEQSPYKEGVDLHRGSGSLHLAGTMIRRAMKAGTKDDWSELTRNDELNPWTRVKLQERHLAVEQDDDQHRGIIQ